MYTLGIDIGASSVKLVAVSLEEERQRQEVSPAQGAAGMLAYAQMRLHKGDSLGTLAALLEEMADALPLDACAAWALTGSGSDMVAERAAHSLTLADVPALTRGSQLLCSAARSVIAIGGQQALFVTNIARAGTPQFAMNDSCAAGTGSFFEDQMQRLSLDIEDYSHIIQDAKSVPRLSGRCSVFAKTDIIHRQQEGVPTSDILLGLCYAMVRSYKALIVRSLPVQLPVALSGGVLKNAGVVKAVREVFELGEDELLVAPENVYFQAAGAALHARDVTCERVAGATGAPGADKADSACAPTALFPTLSELHAALSRSSAHAQVSRSEPLPSIDYDPGVGYKTLPQPWSVDETGKTLCALGIDVGSTSTNLVLLDEKGNLLDAQYLRTSGNPKAAVAQGLASLGARLGERVSVQAVATTGSGRSMIGEYVGADVVRDEITAQARAAAAADAQVDTVFEIGGQDSKFISLKNGQVVDFQMNKICAAGTGSFVEEQAARLDIALSEFGSLALSATSPVDLGERCTVFMETAINAALAKGASKQDVAAGLCQSIIRNYLHRVVGTKPVGTHIVLQGGVNYNAGIVAAFKQFFGEAVTVSPCFAVSGAVGAALLAWEADIEQTTFKGFDLSGEARPKDLVNKKDVERAREFFYRGGKLLLDGYTGTIDPAKKTVGVPRCLVLYKFFPMANAFFSHLGYNVVFSDASDEDVMRLSQQSAQGETCLPVKLIYGHMLELAQRGVDYIFMPSVQTIRHKMSNLSHNYACAYMNTAPRVIADELKLAEQGIELLSPLLDLDIGEQAMATAMLGLGEQLGCDPHETARALLAGSYAVSEYIRKTEEAGQALLDSLEPTDRVMVMVTRNYGISDAILNAGIPDALIERGQKVITISHLKAQDFSVAQDYPNVYWPFGQHILAASKLIRRDPRLFMIYLTNHGCGPDTMISHLVAEEMGDKPYLHIEIDEHFSKVGIITRIEAFLNSIEHYVAPDERAVPLSLKTIEQNERALVKDVPVAWPSFGLPGKAAAQVMRAHGYTVEEIPLSEDALAQGKSLSTSKEYLSFSAQLGMALTAASEAHTAGARVQLLVPSGQGADADGQYDRVIESVLDAAGYSEVCVVAPRLEELPQRLGDVALEQLFDGLLAADVAYAAPRAQRKRIFDELAAGVFAFEEIVACARRVGEAPSAAQGATQGASQNAMQGAFQGKAQEHKRVMVLGEWPLVWEDALTKGAFERMEQRGIHVKHMPASEYFWFLWRDACENQVARIAQGQSTSQVKSHKQDTDTASQTTHQFSRMAEKMQIIHQALGSSSPFSADAFVLGVIADDLVGTLRANNARYRIAKTQLTGRERAADGVLAVSSMYENADIILQLKEVSVDMSLPVLHLGFDGTLDASIDDKIASFCYYL